MKFTLNVIKEKQAAINNQEFEKAASFRDEIAKLEKMVK